MKHVLKISSLKVYYDNEIFHFYNFSLLLEAFRCKDKDCDFYRILVNFNLSQEVNTKLKRSSVYDKFYIPRLSVLEFNIFK